MSKRRCRILRNVERLEPRNLLDGTGLFEVVPDFSLPDANPTSATFGQEVSPRDYLGKVSAWYFGHST